MEVKKNIKFEPKKITTDICLEYNNLCEVIKGLEKKKEEIRASILYAFPEGGFVETYKIDVAESLRRNFKLDKAKSAVSESTWVTVYEPFIELSSVTKLTVKKI